MNTLPYSSKCKNVILETFSIFRFTYREKFNMKNNPIVKRAHLLKDMIADKDKKKHWHFNVLSNKPKARNVFEKIHRPHKRQSVLNSVFIKNITDVMSTGDVAPDLLGRLIEITGLKISPCCKILNVFWQVPESQYEHAEEIGNLLNSVAPKIRAELISRNVIGRVPHIYFLRDVTNEKVAAFEKALKKLNVEECHESSIIPDDSFTKNLYSFKKPAKQEVIEENKSESLSLMTPPKPLDMKCDVFGLDRDAMMEKISASRKKTKHALKETAVVLANSDDLFSRIPGVCFETDSDREKILKTFQTERKTLTKKINSKAIASDYHFSERVDDYEQDDNTYDDFIEEQ